MSEKYACKCRVNALVCRRELTSPHGRRNEYTYRDINSPSYYVESTDSSLRDTEDFIKYCVAASESCAVKLVRPVITPRFVPTCSESLLRGLGRLAEKYKDDVWIQSHASESLDEVKWVESMDITNDEGEGPLRDTEIFRRHGLLRRRSIMAHCVWLTRDERRVFSKQHAAIASCPLSNVFFANGHLRIRDAVEKDHVMCGLGTDVAGGYACSMMSSCRHAVVASRHLSHAEKKTSSALDKDPTISFEYAFWLATTSAGNALQLPDDEAGIGFFAKNMAFDAIIVDTPSAQDDDDGIAYNYDAQDLSVNNPGPTTHLRDAFQRFINLGDDRNVRRVWVGGKEVGRRAA